MSDDAERRRYRLTVRKGDNGELSEEVAHESEDHERTTHEFTLPDEVERQHRGDPVPGTIPRQDDDPSPSAGSSD